MIFLKVLLIISLPDIFYSELTVFFDEEYYNDFFKRNNEQQKWTRLPKNRSLLCEWDIQSNLPELGFLEEIIDEGFSSKGELWFYGDIPENK